MKKAKLISLIFVALTIPSLGFAASILQLKDKRALIDLTGLTGVKSGDQIFAVDATGKRRALLVIRQVRGTRAVADVSRGRAQVGQELQARGGSSATEMSRPARPSAEPADSTARSERLRRSQQGRKEGPAWGLMANLHQTTMDVQFRAGPTQRLATASMGGSSFGVSGFYDYLITKRLQIRALAGLDQISAAGNTEQPDCGRQTTRDCTFDVSYLTLAGQGRYLLNEGTTQFWLGGGGAFLLAMSKASNVLDTSQISTNQVYFISGGVDIGMTRTSFIPLSLDYGLFPSSDTVKANLITMRVGYGWVF